MSDSAAYYRFEFTDWHLYRNDELSLVYRPSVRTLIRRLAWSAVAVMLIVGLHYGFWATTDRLAQPESLEPAYPVPIQEMEQETADIRNSLRDTPSEEEWRDFETREAANRADNQAQIGAMQDRRARIRDIVRYCVLAATALLAALAILPPLLALTEQISVGRDLRGNFIVTHRWFLTRTRSCPLSTLTPFRLTAQQMGQQGGPGSSRQSGYRWIVSTVSDPSHGGSGVNFAFHIDHGMTRPDPAAPLPGRVATFVEGMRRLTGIPHNEPIVLDSPLIERSPFRIQTGVHISRGPAVRTQTFSNLDEIPPELRSEIDAMMGASERKGNPHVEHRVFRSQHITVKDADGNVRTYTSPDEMPAELRAVYEDAKRQYESDRQ